MTVSEFIAVLKTDLGDPDGDLLAENDLLRALTRALIAVNRDIGRTYAIEGDEIVPDPGSESELILLRAHAFCCSMLRSTASAAFSFASADKRVDKSMQAKAWADLEKDLLARYRETVSRLNPELADGLLPVENMRPQIYEVGTDAASD